MIMKKAFLIIYQVMQQKEKWVSQNGKKNQENNQMLL